MINRWPRRLAYATTHSPGQQLSKGDLMAVVYVDDDETICWLLKREWKTACPEHPIHTVHTPAQALAKVADLGGALVALVVDWRLTGTTGEKLVRELRARQPALCILATSAVTDAQQLEAARAA